VYLPWFYWGGLVICFSFEIDLARDFGGGGCFFFGGREASNLPVVAGGVDVISFASCVRAFGAFVFFFFRGCCCCVFGLVVGVFFCFGGQLDVFLGGFLGRGGSWLAGDRPWKCGAGCGGGGGGWVCLPLLFGLGLGGGGGGFFDLVGARFCHQPAFKPYHGCG